MFTSAIFFTAGDEQTPCSGQSCFWPDSSLSLTACHRNRPSDSRKHISTPLSPVMPGSLGRPLLVPTNTLPPATTGFPYDVLPRPAFHLMFVPAWTSHEAGSG